MIHFKCPINDIRIRQNFYDSGIDPCDMCLDRIGCKISAYIAMVEDGDTFNNEQYIEFVSELSKLIETNIYG